jgi:hypothetical protein
LQVRSEASGRAAEAQVNVGIRGDEPYNLSSRLINRAAVVREEYEGVRRAQRQTFRVCVSGLP